MATWRCPYCAQLDDDERARNDFAHPCNVSAQQRAVLTSYVCNNPACRRSTLVATLWEREPRANDYEVLGKQINAWRLIPNSRARAWPDYVPAFIRSDYEESCAIEETSPKASATLARRCLQSLLRDFYGVRGFRSLKEEIDEVEKLGVPGDVSAALHALREIGNIGAHPERDPTVIVDVEPSEAHDMIQLLELLIEETYVATHEREEKLARVKSIAAAKKAPPVA